tara:strand:- start:40 stop:228 length:189 start_codon:yes stop_codon:yes gene_type:complete
MNNTELIYRLMLVWKQYVDWGLDDEEKADCCCDESYIKDLLFDLSHLCDEYGVDFKQALKGI